MLAGLGWQHDSSKLIPRECQLQRATTRKAYPRTAHSLIVKATLDFAAAAERRKIEDPWATEILRIMRRRELVYKLFISSCVGL